MPNLDFIPYVCIERCDFKLRRIRTILVLLAITVSCWSGNRFSYNDKMLSFGKSDPISQQQADSIMRLVIANAAGYANAVSEYDAEIYIKGRSEILKRNILMHFAHHLFPVDKKNANMIFEMVTHSSYQAPNRYVHRFEAANGNSIPNSAKQQEVLAFLNLNVYSPTIYDEGVIMPVAGDAFKYYRFNLESVEDTAGLKIYKIRFLPRQWSQKLVCGDLYILDKIWSIDKIDMNGRASFAEFNVEVAYSRNFRRFLLPEKANLFLRYHVLGNAIVSRYHSAFRYQEVKWVEEDQESKKWKSLDLTSYYRLSSDTVPIVQDTAFWNRQRDVPLTPEEETLYHTVHDETLAKPDSSNATRYLKLTEKLTNTVNLDYRTTRIKYSGILNPFQLGYSARNGITYKQQIRLSKTFDKDRQLRFRPEIGYVFKRKEIFFKVGGDWEYWPERLGALGLTIANGNQSYSSEITDQIKEQLKDSTINFEDLDLKYFRHYYIDLRNTIELFNGFQLAAGVSYHRRVPVKRHAQAGEGVDEIINQDYNDFTPVINLSYTPRQYYRMDGHRKEYVYSYYPTFAVEIARGIPGVWESTGNYCRVEVDVEQSISLGLLRRLNYHLSGGLYTMQKSTYFADFQFFTRHNFPESWNDRLGGVFNLLKGEWFNASDRYVQAHLMYQSPFILFQLFKPDASKYILSERFYVSQLWTPVLPSYTEVGYGFGNHIFNIAVFAGFDRWKYDGIGLKFAFELFQ